MKKTANTGSTAVELEKELGMSEEELFSFAEYHPEEAERTGYSEYSYWKSVFRSFRKNKAAVIMIVVFIAIFIFSYVALVIGKYDYQHLVVDSSLCFQRPNKEFRFGTDNLGRDYWCQVWYATKTSIKLAALVAVGECLVGVTLGCIWGYVRKADRIFTEIYNIFVSVPTMIYMTLIALFIGQSFWVMCASIIFFHWMYMAKNVRNLVFIYRDREYNLASRCLGTRLSRVLTRNILPYLISVIILRVALSIPSTIGLETTLSYLGLGLDINIPSLGILLRNSRAFFLDYPYLLIFPAVIVSLVTITFYLAGNAFSDAADPRNHV